VSDSWEDLNHSLLTPISNTKTRRMHFVRKTGEKTKRERGMYRSNNGRGSIRTLDQNIREGGKTCLQYRLTISINILSIQSYNTGLPNSAQISTSLQIVCVAIERWLVLSQRTASSSSELCGEGPLVCLAWVAGVAI